MGQVVVADAARETILEDARATLTRATAHGGQLAEDAEAALGELVALYALTETEAKAAADAASAARAKRQVANDIADGEVTDAVDDLFEAGGRRRNDPLVAIALPGGATTITRTTLEEQPSRMRLAAKVLGQLRHPRIAPERIAAVAQRIGAAAGPLDQVLRDTADALVADEVADQSLTALARLVRAELIALKRKWIGRRMSESEVHTIIPDRPSPPPKAKPV